MKKGKNTLLALGLAGVLTAGVGFVGAQASTDTTPDNADASTAVTEVRGHRHGGFGRGFGGRGFGGRLALGTDVTYTFYDGDPEAGGTVTDTLDFTYGEDSEVAFAEALATARENAAFAVIQTSEQTRTLELNTDDTDGDNNRRGNSLRSLGRGLNDDSTLTVTFYDGDPEAGGQVTETLSFTYGESSEAGFAAEVEAASEDAAFVTVTTSPQERTVDLSQQPSEQNGGFDRRGSGRGGSGGGRSG